MDTFTSMGNVSDVLARGETKSSVILRSGIQVDLQILPKSDYGAAMHYFTGSKDHNVALRGMAKSRGLKINEYGVFRGDERIAGRTEEEVYAALDLPWFPPEMREARREFDWAAAGKMPQLIELDDVRGDLHVHSTWSDGRASIEEMAAAAKRLGLSYIAITDHSKRVAMAGGLTAAALRRQWAEIDKLNEQLKRFTVLKGVEVDMNGCPKPKVTLVAVMVNFDLDGSELNEEGRGRLDALARALAEDEEYVIEIAGHACDLGTDAYNNALSQRRANVVRDYLLEAGVAEDRMEIVAHGEQDPLVANDTEEQRRQNRRVLITPSRP